LEFQERFSDYSSFSPISSRRNVSSLKANKPIECFGGDCFTSMFTHRMMSNFIDPELPTNTKIVDPACWAKNYAVRCTAELLSSTHSNLTGDSAGFYIPSPSSKKSRIVSVIFGILTGNIGQVVNALNTSNPPEQTEFSNEIAQAFEVYVGALDNSDDTNDVSVVGNDPLIDGEYAEYDDTTN
jgi:hypothetical protein